MNAAFRFTLCFIASIAFSGSNSTQATTIDPLLFEELIFGADFVGIVECEKAGGIVAEYQIVESWKGPKAGGRVTIRIAANYWGPQYPVAFCGQRFLVMAYKASPNTMVSTTSGGGVPLWWRKIPSDYRTPLFQGRQLLDAGQEKTAEFEKTRTKAKTLLTLTPAEQEAALLKAVIEKDLLGKHGAVVNPIQRNSKHVERDWKNSPQPMHSWRNSSE